MGKFGSCVGREPGPGELKALEMMTKAQSRNEVVECDECGFNQGVRSEIAAEFLGWRFTDEGTKCSRCATTPNRACRSIVIGLPSNDFGSSHTF